MIPLPAYPLLMANAGGTSTSPPTIQASNIVISALTSSSMTFSWTNGNGSSRIVLMKAGSAVDSNPVNGTTYTANTVFGSGSQIGSGNYVVKLGSGPVTVTGLSTSTTYYIAVYELNGTGGSTMYLTTSPPTNYATIFTAEYQTVLDWAASNSANPPSAILDKMQENLFLNNLIYEGMWSLSDQIFLLSTRGDSVFSLINIKAPGTRNGSPTVSPVFTPGVGWTPNGTTQYLNTNFTPSTDGVNFTQDNAGMIFFTPTNEASSATKVEIGATQAALLNAIAISLFTSSTVNVRINGLTAFSTAVGASNGLFHLKRPSSTTLEVYKDGLALNSGASVSVGLTNLKITLLAFNSNGTIGNFSTKVGALWIIGAAFQDSAQPIRMEWNISSYYNDYAIAAVSINPPSFSNWKVFTSDLSSYLTSIGALSATFASPPTLNQKLLKGSSLVGVNKWQSGALAENDCIYCAPSTAQTVLKINTLTDTYSTFGVVTATTFKYGGACYATNGKVYFCPQYATAIMSVDTLNSDTIRYFDTTGTVADADSGNLAGSSKWYGFYQGADGRLYAIPYNAKEVMVLDPSNDHISFFDTAGATTFDNGNITGTQKWDSGVLYGNFLYGTPSDAVDFLKIDTSLGTCSRLGTVPAGSAKWSISTLGPNGKIYMFPYFDNRIIKYDPSNDTFAYLAATIGSIDSSIKVAAAGVMPDGRILVVPAEQTTSRLLDTTSDALSSVGKTLASLTATRFIGGVLAKNGASYAIPFTSQFILKQYYTGVFEKLTANHVLCRYSRWT